MNALYIPRVKKFMREDGQPEGFPDLPIGIHHQIGARCCMFERALHRSWKFLKRRRIIEELVVSKWNRMKKICLDTNDAFRCRCERVDRERFIAHNNDI